MNCIRLLVVFALLLSLSGGVGTAQDEPSFDLEINQDKKKVENASATGDYDTYEITLPASSIRRKDKRTAADKVTATLHFPLPNTEGLSYVLPRLKETEEPVAIETPDGTCRAKCAVFAKRFPDIGNFGEGARLAARSKIDPVEFKEIQERKGWGVMISIVVNSQPNATEWQVTQVLDSAEISITNRQKHGNATPPKVKSTNTRTPAFDTFAAPPLFVWAEDTDGVVWTDAPQARNSLKSIANEKDLKGDNLERIKVVQGETVTITRKFRTFFFAKCHGHKRAYFEVKWTATHTIKHNDAPLKVEAFSEVSDVSIIPKPTDDPATITGGRVVTGVVPNEFGNVTVIE